MRKGQREDCPALVARSNPPDLPWLVPTVCFHFAAVALVALDLNIRRLFPLFLRYFGNTNPSPRFAGF